MIAAICCRCRRELGEKGGILLSAPEREGALDGLFCDWVVKYHVCAACMEAVLEWLKTPTAEAAPPVAEKCATCHGMGHVSVSNERTTRTEPCPTCTNPFESPPISTTGYKYPPATPPPARSRLHAACCREVAGGLCARTAEHPGDCDPRVAHEDGRTWTLQMVPPAAIVQTPPAHTGPTTTHVLFEGHALCGFMAGGVPSGWPDGHNWVSIADVRVQEEPPEASRIPLRFSIPSLKENCEPCRRCLTLVPVSSLTRSRA